MPELQFRDEAVPLRDHGVLPRERASIREAANRYEAMLREFE